MSQQEIGIFFSGDAEHKSLHAQNEGILKLDALLWFGQLSGYSQIPKVGHSKLTKTFS